MRAFGTALVCAAVTAADAGAAPAAPAFTVECVRVFNGERMLPESSVAVAAGRIVRVEPGCRPAAEDAVDGRGKTLLPGLIDAHVHAFGNARRDALRFGVTTLLDMFAEPSGLPEARRQRAALDATDQADLWSAGLMATAPGGHGTQYGVALPTLTAPEQAAAWVAARQGEGSDYIKLAREDFTLFGRSTPGPTLDAATAAAVIRAAHAAGLRAVAHVSLQAQAMESVRDGVDGLVHVFHDLPASDAMVALARERKVFVVPTLTVLSGMWNRPSGVADDPRLAPWLTAEQLQSLRARGPGRDDRYTMVLDSVRRLHAAGVPILAGSDAPNPGTAHGAALHDELAHLVAAGLTPVQALAAATSAPARAFGLDDRGRIEPGRRADLLLVEGDPGRDITASRAIVAVWKNGHPVRRDRPAAAKPVATAPAVTAGPVSDFDAEPISSRFGVWLAASDRMRGGGSEAAIRRVTGGAVGSAGALEVKGRINPGLAQPWAGLNFLPGAKPMAPADLSALKELVLMARGDGRRYQVLLFASTGGAPAAASFVAGPDWAKVRLPLKDFAGGDLTRIGVLAIAATAPEGAFELLIDEVAFE